MKNILLAFLCLSFSYPLIAQNLTIPKEIIYYDEESQGPQKEGGRYTVSSTFHPIGWSPDGKLAYMQFTDEYTDGLCLVVVIQDMVSDKILWTTEKCEIDPSAEEGSPSLTENDLLALVRIKIEQALVKYNIKWTQKIDYREESWHRLKGQPYKFAIEESEKQLKIICRAKGLGQKTLLSKVFEEIEISNRDIGHGPNFHIEGILVSPFEDRVAVFCSINEHGFEFIDDEYYSLIGCHLTTGFKE